MKKPQKPLLSIRDERLHEECAQWAKRLGVSKSHVVREALREGLRALEQREGAKRKP
jgi:hypothetical protein